MCTNKISIFLYVTFNTRAGVHSRVLNADKALTASVLNGFNDLSSDLMGEKFKNRQSPRRVNQRIVFVN